MPAARVTSLAEARRRRAVARGALIASVNPATGVTLRTFEPLDEAALDARLARAVAAFDVYRRTPLAARTHALTRLGAVLESEAEACGRLIATERGTPIAAAVADVRASARACRHLADALPAWLADEPLSPRDARSFVRFEPLGPVLAVLPWNVSFGEAAQVAAGALAAGNAVLLRHAPNLPQAALLFERLAREAGFEEGVVQTLLVTSAQVDRIVEDERVAAVTVAGSAAAAAPLASRAGAKLKKTVLTLGGSDPFLVLAGADVDRAARAAVAACMADSGQSTIAAKRVIVVDAVYERFAASFVNGLAALVVGDPLDPATQVGPLVSAEALEILEAQVQRSVAAGARVLVGGGRAPRDGFFYEPTALADVPLGAPAWREELLGPVATLARARDLAEAVRLANDSAFGLGASVWSEDAEECRRAVDAIEAGMVFANAPVTADPRRPFGGVKRSGPGRALGRWGVRELVNVKTVWIADRPAGDAEPDLE